MPTAAAGPALLESGLDEDDESAVAKDNAEVAEEVDLAALQLPNPIRDSALDEAAAAVAGENCKRDVAEFVLARFKVDENGETGAVAVAVRAAPNMLGSLKRKHLSTVSNRPSVLAASNTRASWNTRLKQAHKLSFRRMIEMERRGQAANSAAVASGEQHTREDSGAELNELG